MNISTFLIGESPLDNILIAADLGMYKFFKLFKRNGPRTDSPLTKLIFPVNIQKPTGEICRIFYIFELFTYSCYIENKAFLSILLNPKYKYLLDLGSNIGRLSYIFLSQDKTRKSIMLDANPVHKVIIDNFVTNKNRDFKDSISVYTYALGDHDNDSLVLYTGEKDPSVGRATFDSDAASKWGLKYQIPVKLNTFDTIAKVEKLPIYEIDLIKIDVEGWEDKVLLGMDSTLRNLVRERGKIDLIIEIWEDQKVLKIEKLLKKIGNVSTLKLMGDDYLFTISKRVMA